MIVCAPAVVVKRTQRALVGAFVSAARTAPTGLRRAGRTYMLAYEALIQRQFTQDPAFPGEPVFIVGSGRWVTHHAMAMIMFNLDTMRSTSNALSISLEFLDGRNQHGRLIEYDSIRTGAIGLQSYW